jgi:hypothetical protein
MVKCSKCGAEIKYIPMGHYSTSKTTETVDAGYIEIINDNGRMIKGHLRHKCPTKIEIDAATGIATDKKTGLAVAFCTA